MDKIILNTSWGDFLGIFENNNIINIKFPGDFNQQLIFDNKKKVHHKYENEIDLFLKGEKNKIQIPYILRNVTPFQKTVLLTLKEKVKYGNAIYYSDLAFILKSKACQAIGSCMAMNPLPLIFPCHRIISKKDNIGNFGPGVFYKKKLLKLEKENKYEFF